LARTFTKKYDIRWYQHHLPNFFTFLRLLATPAIFYFIISHSYLLAFVVFAFAGLSDWADGYYARKWNVTSTFGRILDPIADKAMMSSCFIILTIKGLLPLWLVSLMVGRDLTILLAGFYTYIKRLNIKFIPIFVSKLNTLLQILLIGTCLIFNSEYINSLFNTSIFCLYNLMKSFFLSLIGGCTITTLWSWWCYGVYFIQKLKARTVK
jgi:cardiolipin synthase